MCRCVACVLFPKLSNCTRITYRARCIRKRHCLVNNTHRAIASHSQIAFCLSCKYSFECQCKKNYKIDVLRKHSATAHQPRDKKARKMLFTQRNSVRSIVILIGLVALIESATTHKHNHQHSDERLEDGAYRPRDAGHHGDDGEHNADFDHEAILGSVKAAEEFDQLSPEESKRRLRLLVISMDLNKDGFIDRHELKAHILRSFKSLSEEEANDRFDEVDADSNEIVTWREYLKEMYSIESAEGRDELENEIPDQGLEQSKLIDDDRSLFKAADSNKDGELNRDEFVLFISPEEHPQMLPIILNQTLRDKDKNGDGKIDFQEFVGDGAREHDKEWLIAEKERFDSEYDKDQDGILNGNEILSWIVPSNDDVASDEVDHLFASADNDHDDRLTYDEIVDNHDIFVGSEATDYGDHLQNIDKFNDEL